MPLRKWGFYLESPVLRDHIFYRQERPFFVILRRQPRGLIKAHLGAMGRSFTFLKINPYLKSLKKIKKCHETYEEGKSDCDQPL